MTEYRHDTYLPLLNPSVSAHRPSSFYRRSCSTPWPVSFPMMSKPASLAVPTSE
jgi:hypothetical protein